MIFRSLNIYRQELHFEMTHLEKIMRRGNTGKIISLSHVH